MKKKELKNGAGGKGGGGGGGCGLWIRFHLLPQLGVEDKSWVQYQYHTGE